MDGSDEELEGDDEIDLEELVNLIDDGIKFSKMLLQIVKVKMMKKLGRMEFWNYQMCPSRQHTWKKQKGNQTMSEEEKITHLQGIGYKNQDITQQVVGIICRRKINSSKP